MPSDEMNGVANPDWDGRFNDGRKWALEQLHEENGEVSLTDVGEHTSRAVAAFIALSTGRLPSLTCAAIDEHMVCTALRHGFGNGVRVITHRGTTN